MRTLVVRRAGLGRKVAMLSSDPALRAALEQNRCTVLVDPEDLEALSAFGPQVVVAFDGFLAGQAEAFELLSRAAPEAQLLVSFSNSASASTILRALSGVSPAPGASESEVERWLRAAGYVTTSRDLVVSPHQPSGLSADTEAALRQLFEQLNPSAAADRLLVSAKRGATASRPDRVKGRVSVIVSASEAERQALKGTLASLAAQTRKQVEVVLASPLSLEQSDQALSPLRGRAHLTTFAVTASATDWAARTNAGLAVASGQYVAFLEAGALLEPRHLEQLCAALEASTLAWALSNPGPSVSGPFRLARWLEQGLVERHRWLVDRDRLGAFALTFAEASALSEAMLFTRLALLFTPALAGGPVSVDAPRAPFELSALLEVLRARPLRSLSTLDALLEKPALGSLLEERLEQLRPGAGRTLGRALAWWRELPVEPKK